MVQGGGVEGREGSGSGFLLTESSDISRRILSNLLKRDNNEGNREDINRCTQPFFVLPCQMTLQLPSNQPINWLLPTFLRLKKLRG